MGRWTAAALAAALSLGPAAAVAGESPEVYLMPLAQYTTPKGRALASAHKADLLRLYDHIYYCIPWVDVAQSGIGFPKRRGSDTDDRYLSLWINVDQTDDGAFRAMSQPRRASAMLSRYGVDMLRRMSTMTRTGGDANLYGYSIILSWLKPGDGTNPTKETLAFFTDKRSLGDYLAKSLAGADFVGRSKYSLFDGKERVEPVHLEVWDDPFNRTFKLKNYEAPKEKKC
jgi:hypothetical protein